MKLAPIKNLAIFASLSLASPLAFAYRVPEFNIRAILWNILVLAGIAVIFGIVDYAVSKAPFIQEPVKQVVHWVLVVILCVVLIFFLLDFLGL